MEENVYKKARLDAVQQDQSLRTAERACSKVCISRERLLMIEQSDPHRKQALPNPDEVMMMAKVYHAPQLRDYYCTHHCPVGQDRKPLIHDSLTEIATGLMAALYFLDDVEANIHGILEDGQVSEEEKKEFSNSLRVLRKIAYSANCLELWAKKNNMGD